MFHFLNQQLTFCWYISGLRSITIEYDVWMWIKPTLSKFLLRKTNFYSIRPLLNIVCVHWGVTKCISNKIHWLGSNSSGCQRQMWVNSGEIDLNTLRPRQNGRHFADDIFKCIFVNEIVWIPIEISLKFVSKGSINNYPALFQIMAWRRPGDKPLSEPIMVSSLTHICITRAQWVKISI